MTFGSNNTPFEALGGQDAVRALAESFYGHMDRDEAFADIRALHPEDLSGSRTTFFEFLCGWLGGPQLYAEKHGHPRLRMRHASFVIGDNERDQWLACMAKALDENNITGEVRAFLDERFAHVADFMRNR